MSSAEAQQYGIVGLGVMGSNLLANLRSKGTRVAAYSVSADERQAVLARDGVAADESLPEFVARLVKPRVVLLMVTAGAPVDEVLSTLLPLLDDGDIVVDGGNSHFADSERRTAECARSGVQFLGVGISGGEVGAREGASMMAGGDATSFAHAEPMFQQLSCRVGDEFCYGWMGRGGAGHFVKTVHNGIEYGVMQLIAEAYDFMHRGLRLPRKSIQAWFAAQRQGPLDSYLIDITTAILGKRDDLADGYLLDVVADRAGQKGTGRWCVDAAMELGVPLPTIIAAVTERQISGQLDTRAGFAEGGQERVQPAELMSWEDDVQHALLTGVLAAFAQGLALISVASERFGWETDLSAPVRVWRGGCIIRAALLDEFLQVATHLRSGQNLLLAPPLHKRLLASLPGTRRVLTAATASGIPMPATAGTLNYIDSLRSPTLPTRLVQAQRDCFGAHTFERTDRPGSFHAGWLE